MIVQKEVEAVLTGRCGPNASEVFQANGVSVIMGVDGTVREATERYVTGELSQGTQTGMGATRGGKRTSQGGIGASQEDVEQLEAEVRDMKARLNVVTHALDDLGRHSR